MSLTHSKVVGTLHQIPVKQIFLDVPSCRESLQATLEPRTNSFYIIFCFKHEKVDSWECRPDPEFRGSAYLCGRKSVPSGESTSALCVSSITASCSTPQTEVCFAESSSAVIRLVLSNRYSCWPGRSCFLQREAVADVGPGQDFRTFACNEIFSLRRVLIFCKKDGPLNDACVIGTESEKELPPSSFRTCSILLPSNSWS